MADAQFEMLEEVRANLARLTALTEATAGECQKGTGDVVPLHPVLMDNDELRWCCGHTPKHCSEPVAAKP